MSRVFAIQVPARREAGQWIEKFDLSAAEHFGELIRCLPYGNVPSDPEVTRKRLFEAFADFDHSSDYVLLLGDPVAIAQAASVLTELSEDPFMALKWDRREGRYEIYYVG